MKTIIIFTFLCMTFYVANSQSNLHDAPQPEIGKPMPDFELNNITHYKTTKATLEDFKGNWLFLDFWYSNCINCIKSFPKANSFQQQFKGKLQWLLVGLNSNRYNKGIEVLYEKLKSKLNLDIPSSYDSVLVSRLGIQSMPHIIIIDPNGIVKAITDGRDITREKIQDLLDGKTVAFYSKDVDRPDFDASQLSNATGINKGEDKMLFASILTIWGGENQMADDINQFVKLPPKYLMKGFQTIMVPLFSLYNQAYFGQWRWGIRDSLYGNVYPEPILELRDSSLFEYDYGNKGSIKGVYNYYLKVPVDKLTRELIMSEIQHQLKSVFGYEVAIENRKISVWKLTARPGTEENLKSKGGMSYFGDENGALGSQGSGFSFRNYPADKNLLFAVTHYIEEYGPFIDVTAITGNIDINMENVLMTNIQSVKKALQKNGLDLLKGEREMKVLVIKDPKPENK